MELFRVTVPAANELTNKGFTVYRGWNERLASELVINSRQEHIVENTPGDMERRFSDIEAAQRWHDLGKRTIYSLYATDPDALAGIIWGDVRARPDIAATHTFGIRLYESAVGKKLAQPFMQAALDDFRARRRWVPTLWLERNTDDQRTKHLYEKFGFIEVQEENGRTTMVLKSDDPMSPDEH